MGDRMNASARILVLLFLLGWTTAVSAETVRPAVWAGKFYPEEPKELRQTIATLAAQAARTPLALPSRGVLRGLILPHAGYVYSGRTAAFSQKVLQGQSYRKVVLMGPDHRVGFSGASVSDARAYQTPLGQVPLHNACQQLCRNKLHFRTVPEADRQEHSLEVVLPFLQTALTDFALVPVVMGSCDPGQIAAALAPVVGPDTLVVASADLSHYLPYEKAVVKDSETIHAILALDDKPLLKNENRTCGRYPVAVLLELARRFDWQPVLLHYSNSGDTAGGRNAVVGYAAVAFYGDITMDNGPNPLTAEQGQTLLRLARQTLIEKFGRPGSEKEDDLKAQLDDPALQRVSGVFVTLKIDKQLRGCIGTLSAHEPLSQGVRTFALHAAFDDPRFSPLSAAELAHVTIEVSVLTQPQPLAYDDAEDLVAKLRPDVDGVTIRKGVSSATFLPQVWEQLPGPEAFLSHLCMKAGMSADEWRKGRLEVETYQVQYFEEYP